MPLVAEPGTLVRVDAFASSAFAGNQAVVCLLDAAADEGWMAALAAELAAPATAFLHPIGGGWGLRWFAPAREIPLCGHGSLAAAHALWDLGPAGASEEIVFTTPRDRLVARRHGDWIELDLPRVPLRAADAPPGLAAALGVPGTALRMIGAAPTALAVELGSARDVRELRPDGARILELPIPAVYVTSRGDGDADIVSRNFHPANGELEDAVTGSMHACLGPWWAERLGTSSLLAHQASARGGVLRVTPRGERVGIAGQAVTVARGRLAAAALPPP